MSSAIELEGRCRRLSKTDRLLICRWAFTGLTHSIMEGTFAVTPDFCRKENPSYFDEASKLSVIFPICHITCRFKHGASTSVLLFSERVEAVTAVLEGPASLLAIYAIASRKSYNNILQVTVCLGQLYGCLVYFITAYFIGANSSWVVIPTLIAIRSWKMIYAAFRAEKVKIK
ncbi:probable 3-beta-hydroxysteroid-Delta(8),Delta(7)-isomerase [Phragmites australis]|uniref:probable 3-beta-hydroxysteroid-Delta(8),Delta(7)-isomerase n=1 Tax=Phragmites australis TaxID=29695 RepID=UPI002D7899F2|nr:probable 3-beta-hydroxysteroid-Delta(8),Delta(7)-isomerase [Phragmites australis]